jgi:hypothetical protein
VHAPEQRTKDWGSLGTELLVESQRGFYQVGAFLTPALLSAEEQAAAAGE